MSGATELRKTLPPCVQTERTAIMLIKMKWMRKSTGNKFSCHLEVLSVYLTFRPYYYYFFLKLKLWLAFSTTLIRNVSVYIVYIAWLSCTIAFLGSLCWTSWIFLKNLVWPNCLLQLLWIHSKMAVVVLITYSEHSVEGQISFYMKYLAEMSLAVLWKHCLKFQNEKVITC